MVTNGNHNGKGGRPKKPIDWKEAEKLCALQCSEQEICDWFHVSTDTLDRRLHDEKGVGFKEFFSLHRVQGKIALRRNLFKLSEHHPQAAIFMSKNWLGMADKHEVTGEDGGPVQHSIKISVMSEGAKKLTERILEGEKTE